MMVVRVILHFFVGWFLGIVIFFGLAVLVGVAFAAAKIVRCIMDFMRK